MDNQTTIRPPSGGKIPGWTAGIVLVLCLLVLAVIFGHAIVRFALVTIVEMVTSTRITSETMDISIDRLVATGLNIRSKRDEPVATIRRLDVAYNLRDLLPGGSRLFGLRSIEIDDPHVTIIRRPDGTYNIPVPQLGGPGKPGGPPMHFTGRVGNGTLTVLDATRVHANARRLDVDGFNAKLDINTAARSTYQITLNYVENGRRYPLRGVADIDPPVGFSVQHWTMARLPIARLINYAANNASLTVASGEIIDLDGRMFSLPNGRGGMDDRIAGSTYLRDMRVYADGLVKPVRNIHGRLDASSNGMLSERLDGELAGVPARVSGGVYDLSNPKLRVSVAGTADLAKLRTASPMSANLPVTGTLRFGALAEGTIAQPLTLIALASPLLVYHGIPVNSVSGVAALDGREADVVQLHARYGAIAANVQGRAVLHKQPDAIAMFVGVNAPAGSIPYAESFVPGMPLGVSMLATADDPKQIEVRGLLNGRNATQTASGVFHVSGDGVGSVGPFFVGNDRASIYARAQLDHPHRQSIALFDARNLQLRPASAGSLPGFANLALPRVAGTFSGHLVGGEDRARYGLSGNLAARNVHAAGATIGAADIPFAAFADGRHTIVQIDRARVRGLASGVSVGDISATIAATGNSYRIYAARAAVAGGDVLAAGSFGRGGRLAVSASGLNLSGFRTGNVPMQVNRVDFGSEIGGSMTNPSVDASVVMNGSYSNYGVDGNAAFLLANRNLDLRGATVGVGPAFVGINGTIANVPFQAANTDPRVDLNVRVRAIDVHDLAAMFQPKIANDVAGAVDADAHVTGDARSPQIAGSFGMTHGAYHGLGFEDLGARVSGGSNALALRGGHVTFGSTTVDFSGNVERNAVAVALSAPRVDLSDFNDYFDLGDTLAGEGELSLAASLRGGTIATTGNASIDNTRVRSMDLGRIRAQWATNGRTIGESLYVNGSLGHMRAQGNVTLPVFESNNVSNVVREAEVSIAASAHDLDLNAWLPIAGVRAPVSGKLDVDALVRGRYPGLNIEANANLRDGIVSGVAVQRFAVAMSAAGGYGRLKSATAELPYLHADASGTFGLSPSRPIGFTAHVNSGDIGALMHEFNKKAPDVAGRVNTTVHVSGTFVQPAVLADVDVASLRFKKFVVPRVVAQIHADVYNVAVRNGEADLAQGRLLLSGTVPIRVKPTFAVDPSHEPIAVALTADDVELSNFTSFFPDGTKLGGRVDGTVRAAGTMQSPTLNGTLGLAGGSFVGPLEKSPITNAVGELVFNERSVQLRGVQAGVGGGTFTASGSVAATSLRTIADSTVQFNASLNGANIDAPSYYRGQIDANVSVARHANDPLTVGGNVAFSNARVPLSALFNPNAPKQPAQHPPDVAFNAFHVEIGRDVRVQSGFVDVGAEGAATVGGTLASPTLSGRFRSTGGTVSFYRLFRIQHGVATFDPSSGIYPTIDAVATTRVPDPTTDITLRVTGQAPDNMNVDFTSDPYYSREQILGLLVGAQYFGAVAGVQTNGGGSFSASSAIQNLAAGQVNQVFTRHLLEPLSNSIGETLGFSNFQIYNDLGTGFGATGERALSHNISFFGSALFYYPRRFTYGIRARPTRALTYQLQAYTQQIVNPFGPTPQTFALYGTSGAPAAQQVYLTGSNGIDFSVKREYPVNP